MIQDLHPLITRIERLETTLGTLISWLHLNPLSSDDALKLHLMLHPAQAPPCWICGKSKGQPPERCPGHYEGTSSAAPVERKEDE
jgi:hypothetical protein